MQCREAAQDYSVLCGPRALLSSKFEFFTIFLQLVKVGKIFEDVGVLLTKILKKGQDCFFANI